MTSGTAVTAPGASAAKVAELSGNRPGREHRRSEQRRKPRERLGGVSHVADVLRLADGVLLGEHALELDLLFGGKLCARHGRLR
jgi:hypothetical protein